MVKLQLRELEQDGLVKRTVYAQVPPRVDYEVTAFGRSLEPVLHGCATAVTSTSVTCRARLIRDVRGLRLRARAPFAASHRGASGQWSR